ncbi:hypothetical protein JOC54_000272 [Alkalihalobacillus xiaoxiensis]|uniref:Uncharacterized protein n=1 Tax=Shouchella xiaoxiensis TaxID=766895 RepID=A0ABS2SPW1_9BACI|nr:hypothetical protein [Shouchella xiaoxiensis]MBM7837041.1 hypothetical protein [Shouchella xiaoxiensis]
MFLILVRVVVFLAVFVAMFSVIRWAYHAFSLFSGVADILFIILILPIIIVTSSIVSGKVKI